MLTKDVSSELENAIQSLHDLGKQPTVALVKARLSTNVPMPAIIAAIKSWKGKKPMPKIEVAAEQMSAENKISKLEQQVADLIERIEILEAKQ